VLGSTLVSRAALSRFEAQGHGVLVVTSSILAVVPNPVVPTYTMSKFAIRGLLLSLHAAYRRHDGIHICEVMPGPIDTPLFAHAGNHSGHVLRAIPPACAPERAAAALVRSAVRPRRRRVVGITGRVVLLGVRVVPRFTQWAVATYSGRLILTGSEAASTPGALHAPPAGPRTVSGGWRRGAQRRRIGAALGRSASRHG
jgi:NAD(P)-dependent dehydrogenase (short-subunit alcohol dehydrogenase family)